MVYRRSFNPFEIRTASQHSYESIPEIPAEDFLSNGDEAKTFPPKSNGDGTPPSRMMNLNRLIVVTTMGCIMFSGCAVVVVSLLKKSNLDVPPTHLSRPHFVPTLLSVFDPKGGGYVYALNRTLYNDMRYNAEFLHVDDSKWRGHELPLLFLDKTTISVDESITVSWSMGRDGESGNALLREDDIIALYCGGPEEEETHGGRFFLEVATVAQARATSVKNGGHEDGWFIPHFPILRQSTCHFRLYANVTDGDETKRLKLVLMASTELLTVVLAKETPTAIHLALTESFSKMVIQFTTGEVSSDAGMEAVPVVRYTKLSDAIEPSQAGTTLVVHGTSDTYVGSDLCGAPANQVEAGKFYPPGLLHTIELDNLEPSTTYEYQVGVSIDGSVRVWSDPARFDSPPEVGNNRDEFNYIVYGDQGCPETGCEDGFKWIDAMVEREPTATAVHHFGDISYANGAAHIWDAWFQMIRPFSARLPLMIAIGNHEYDHLWGGLGKDDSGVTTDNGYQPQWGNFADDSGGECGVPMVKRFRMPSSVALASKYSSNGVFWYSYDYANVHTVVVSSEHDMSKGSDQYYFIEHDLKTVDRSKTPWVVLESHRPLYEGEGGAHWQPQTMVSEAMRGEVEDLLYLYSVDLVLAGHYHEYHRTCDRLYKGVCNTGNGPIHITIGAAGAPLDSYYAATYDNEWTDLYLRGVYGYGRLTVANATAMHIEFIRHGEKGDPLAGEVLDDVWIHRDRSSNS